MSAINIERLERMHNLICRRATGNPDEFAEKLGISKSMLMVNLGQLKERGGPIRYDSISQTYSYTRPCRLIFGYEMEEEELGKVKGGENTFENFWRSNNIRMGFYMFAVQGI